MSLDPKQQENVRQYLKYVWNMIAGDIFNANGNEEMKQRDVIEVVLDQAYGCQHGLPKHFAPETKQDMASFNQLPPKQQESFAKTVFPYKTYVY